MTGYRIVCTEKESSHSHIQRVGVSARGGNHSQTLSRTLSIAEVYALLADGDTFHTGSPGSSDYAHVARLICTNCGQPTLRSDADDHWNDSLDNLPICR